MKKILLVAIFAFAISYVCYEFYFKQTSSGHLMSHSLINIEALTQIEATYWDIHSESRVYDQSYDDEFFQCCTEKLVECSLNEFGANKTCTSEHSVSCKYINISNTEDHEYQVRHYEEITDR